MNAKEFYLKEKCEDSVKYDITPMAEWWFGEFEMILFAEEYYRMKISERLQSENDSNNDGK